MTFHSHLHVLIAVAFAFSVAGPALAATGTTGWQVVYPHRSQPLFHQGSGVGVDRLHHVYVADLVEGREKKFSASGKLLASWSLSRPDLVRIWQPSRLVVDAQGNSYLLLDGVAKYSPSGKLLFHWNVGSDSIAIAVSPQGTVYLLSSERTPDKKGGRARVDELSSAGAVVASLYTPILALKAVQPDGLAVDSHGNVYVTVATDNTCYRVCLPRTSVLYRFSPAGMLTWTFRPKGISFGPIAAVDAQGTVYLLPHDVNYDQMSLEKLSPTGKILAVWPSIGGQRLGDTVHVALDGGRLYVTDSHVFDQSPIAMSGVVRVVSQAGKQLARWGTFLNVQMVSFNLGLAIGPGGKIYVTGGQNGPAYTVLTPAGKILRTVGKTGPNAAVQDARSIRVDSRGNVYIVDGIGGRVDKFSPAGKFLARWPLPGAPTVGADDVALDRAGNIYVTAPSIVFKLSPQGKLLGRIGGPGTGPGRFGGPGGITVDAHGNLYVADTYNNRIQKLSPSGRPLAQWGGPKQFDRPIRVTLDPAGNVYVIDLTHYLIQKLSPQGKLLAVIGKPGIQPGQFIGPTSLAFDGSGALYVLDHDNNRIQRLPPTG